MAGALHTPVPQESGHTIFYLAGEDTPADRHNVALLARLARRSTTPLSVEIFYHRPLQLSNWAEATGSLRYRRLRSGSEFVLAERLATARTECVLFFSFSVFAHSEDLWRLLGHAVREPFTLVLPSGVLADRGEPRWTFALRSARTDLARYTGSPDQPAIMAINRRLLGKYPTGQRTGLLLRKFYADLLRGQQSPAPLLLTGRSRVFAARGSAWLSTLRNTVFAYRAWRANRQFPWWFSYRHPLFLVAQLGFYLSILVLPASMRGSLLLLLFSVATTTPYCFGGLSREIRTLFSNVRRPAAFLRCMGARLILYLIG